MLLEEKNPKKLKMLFAQEEANRLKEELKNMENDNKLLFIRINVIILLESKRSIKYGRKKT